MQERKVGQLNDELLIIWFGVMARENQFDVKMQNLRQKNARQKHLTHRERKSTRGNEKVTSQQKKMNSRQKLTAKRKESLEEKTNSL